MPITFNSYNDDQEGLVGTKVKLQTILVVGLTGSGKSSIIKSICSLDDTEHIEAKMSIRSVTKNLKVYEGNQITNPKNRNEQYVINLVDTVGLGDTDITVPTILKQIIEAMPTDLSKIHKVVFCFKMDRLRAKMSEELNILYNFFRMVGAKPENFVVCLTFCDILNDDTIGKFWNDLETHSDLSMMKDIQTVTYTAFPNLEECDKHPDLHRYLQEKMRVSTRRVFEHVIEKRVEPFFPQKTMLTMPAIEFDKLCSLLRDYNNRRHWWWNVLKKSDQEDIIQQIIKLRSPNTLTGATITKQ